MKEKTADPLLLFAIKKVTPGYEPQAWQAEGCERCQHCRLVRQQVMLPIETKSQKEAHV